MSKSLSNPISQRERTALLLTILENTVLGVLYALFAFAAFKAWLTNGSPQPLLIALQEALIVVIAITRRRSVDVSQSWSDIVIAFAGTALPMLQRSGGFQLPMLIDIGIVLQIIGAGFSVVATWSLGRSFGIIPANRGVKTGGLYRFVRHPIYGSYLIGYIGFLLGNLSLANTALIAVSFFCQYLRARAEEQVLLRDPLYAAYAQRVRWRFLPFLF